MLLLIPGPVQTHPSVQAAMAKDIAPWGLEFQQTTKKIKEEILSIANGDADYHCVLPFPAPGHFALEATICSLVPKNKKILVPANGMYGEHLQRIASDAGYQVVKINKPDTEPFTGNDIAGLLQEDKEIEYIALAYSETGSGVINDVESIGQIALQFGKRLIIDAISAFGALPFDLSQHPECDALIFTSGKCFEGMPGISFVIAHNKALEKNKDNVQSWTMNLHDIFNHGARNSAGHSRFTPPAQILSAFSTALDLYKKEGGQPLRLSRYQTNAEILYNRLSAYGLVPYLSQTVQGPIVVTFHQPLGFDFSKFAKILKSKEILISKWTTQQPTIRFSAIGSIDSSLMNWAVDNIIDALEETKMQIG